jgi:hypothetical protein
MRKCKGPLNGPTATGDHCPEGWSFYRVPYPLGFYMKGMEGRIDAVNAGWKGRGIWVTEGDRTPPTTKAEARR